MSAENRFADIEKYIKDENLIYNVLRLNIISSVKFCEYLLHNSKNPEYIKNKFVLYIGYLAISRYKLDQYLCVNVDIKSTIVKKHFLSMCNDMSYLYIYRSCGYEYYRIHPNKEKVDINFVLHVHLDDQYDRFFKVLLYSNSKDYRTITKKKVLIYSQNIKFLEYCKKNNNISDDTTFDMIRNDWIEAILWLLKNNKIQISMLFYRWMQIKKNYPKYWNKISKYYISLTQKYKNNIEDKDLALANILFPDIYSGTDNYNYYVLSMLDPIHLSYLLGMSIHNTYLSNTKDIMKRLRILTDIGPTKYYDKIIQRNKNNIKDVNKLKNTKDSYIDDIFSYSISDIIIVKSNNNNILHAFTRPEFTNMNNKNNFINYYTKHKFSHLVISEIKKRLSIAKYYNLPTSCNLPELYNYYIKEGVNQYIVQNFTSNIDQNFTLNDSPIFVIYTRLPEVPLLSYDFLRNDNNRNENIDSIMTVSNLYDAIIGYY